MPLFNQWNTSPQRVLGWAVLALLGLACGCSGPKLQNVSGTVTLDGQPLTEGTVQFSCPGDRLSTARIQPDGSFVATDVRPGDEVRVAVIENPDAAMMKRAASRKTKSTTPPVDSKPAAPGNSRPIPYKYKTFNTSGLSYNINPSSPQIEIQLQSH
jgi:hypothetical protein